MSQPRSSTRSCPLDGGLALRIPCRSGVPRGEGSQSHDGHRRGVGVRSCETDQIGFGAGLRGIEAVTGEGAVSALLAQQPGDGGPGGGDADGSESQHGGRLTVYAVVRRILLSEEAPRIGLGRVHRGGHESEGHTEGCDKGDEGDR